MSKSKGNVVTPAGPAARVRHGRGAVLGGQRPARAWTPPSTRRQLKVGRRLAIKILNASRFVLGFGRAARRGTHATVTEPLDRAMLARLAGLVDAVHRGVRGLRPRRWRWSRPSGSSGSSATTTWSWSRPGPTASAAPAAAGVGGRRAAAGAVGAAAAVRAVPAVRDRGSVVVVAGRVGAPGRRGRSRAELARPLAAGAADEGLLDAASGAIGCDPQGQVPGQAAHAGQRAAARGDRARAPAWPPWPRCSADVRAAGVVADVELRPAAGRRAGVRGRDLSRAGR